MRIRLPESLAIAALAVSVALGPPVARPVFAQEDVAKFPSRPITFISPFPASTSSDLACRLIVKEAERTLGKPVVILNELLYSPDGVRTPGGAAMPLADIAARSLAAGAPLAAEGRFSAKHMNYPYGIHAAVVRVDPGTCGVSIERFVIAYDIGRAVNPMLVEGQLVGAAAQGIGGALYEEFVYD